MKMKTERLFERFADFHKALVRLREALAAPETELHRDAAIQRFEFTYELTWKTVQLCLQFKGIDVRNPRETLREALQQGIIEDGNGWSVLHENRNLTSHTYDETLAVEVYDFIKKHGLTLLEALEQEIKHRTDGESS